MQHYASLVIVNIILVILFLGTIVDSETSSTMNYRVCQCIKKTELFRPMHVQITCVMFFYYQKDQTLLIQMYGLMLPVIGNA